MKKNHYNHFSILELALLGAIAYSNKYEDGAFYYPNSQNLQDALNSLEDREREAILLRWGIDDNKPKTLKEVGQILKKPVTPERFRQIEAKALRKLRHPSRQRLIWGKAEHFDVAQNRQFTK